MRVWLGRGLGLWAAVFVVAFGWYIATGGDTRNSLPNGLLALLGVGVALTGSLIFTQSRDITGGDQPIVPIGYRLAGVIMIGLGTLIALLAVPRG